MGDTISVNGLMSEEATEECNEYYKSPNNLVTLSGKFLRGAETNLTKEVLFNLTRLP